MYDLAFLLLLLLSLVPWSWYGEQVSELAGLGGVVRGLGLPSGCNSDYNAPADSSATPSRDPNQL